MYTRVNAMKILSCFDVRCLHIHMYNRSCNDGWENIATASRRFDRCPRVVNTFYATHDCRWLFFFFLFFPPFFFIIYENVCALPCEVKITRQFDGIKYLKRWEYHHSPEWKNFTRHKMCRVDEIMMAGEDT